MLARVRITRRSVQQVTQRRILSSVASCPKGHRYSLITLILASAVGATVGSGVLIGAGYVWYLTSPYKRIVDHVQPALAFLKDTRAELGKKAPSHVLSHLRQACKAYLAFVPFSSYAVDRGFDALDDVVDAHADEANAIIGEAAAEVMQVIQRDGNEHKTSAVIDTISIMRKLLKKLNALGLKAGQPLMEKLELERKANELKETSARVVSETVEKVGKKHIPKVRRWISGKSEDEE